MIECIGSLAVLYKEINYSLSEDIHVPLGGKVNRMQFYVLNVCVSSHIMMKEEI